MVLMSYLRGSFNHIPELLRSMKSEWAMFHAAIVKVDAQSYTSKVTGAGRGSAPKTHRWTPDTNGAIKLKKETYKSCQPLWDS